MPTSDQRWAAPATGGSARYWAWAGLCIVLSLVLRWPLLYVGLGSDDYVHKAALDGVFAAPRAPLDLFNFASGNAADNRRLVRYGSLPWWTDPRLRLSMFRPGSSALAMLDETLFPRDPVTRHGLSMLVFAGLCAAVAALYIRVLPPTVAGLALLMFVLDEGHNLPVGWLAHRGGLLALFFGVLAIRHVIVHRERSRLTRHGGAVLWLSAALLFGEWALPIYGYLLAYGLFVESGPARARLQRLWPLAVPALLYLCARGLSGRGVSHSGIYVDPLHEPLRYLSAAATRIPVLVADLTFSLDAIMYHFGNPFRDAWLRLWPQGVALMARLPSWPVMHVMLGLSGLFVLGLGGLWLRRNHVPRPVCGFLLGGALLSLLPVAGGFASSRLALPAAIGYSGLAAMAVFAAAHGFARATLRAKLGRAAVVAGVLGVSLVETARSGQEEIGVIRALYDGVRRTFRSEVLDDRTLAGQRLFLVGALDHTTMVFGPYVLHALGRPMPRGMWVLSGADRAHRLTRVSDRTVRLSALSASWMNAPLERLYRRDGEDLHAGDRVALDGAVIEVVHVHGGKPRVIDLHLPRPADASEYLFVLATAQGLRRLSVPPVGESLVVPPPALPLAGL